LITNISFFSYAGRHSAAATATGIKSSHLTEQKAYMQQAMAI
jgi:2-oxoglutarate dehydrogenase complex dehydrogenase (E1) component-like enzyme